MQRPLPRRLVLPAALGVLFIGTLAKADSVSVPPDGPEQMPVLYVHGYLDDGTGWARDALYLVEQNVPLLSYKYARYYVLGPERSASTFFHNQGIDNWAVQWWAGSSNNASPFSGADTGFAFLQDRQELLAGTDWVRGTWTAQNFAVPNALDVFFSTEADLATALVPKPTGPFADVIYKAALASLLSRQPNYNSAGTVDDRAEDFLDMLRTERRPGGRLDGYRQVNVITHSMGSLVTRATLHKAEEASREDSEFVANVIYNAPPFAGSTMAYLNKIYFEQEPVTRALFSDPWLVRMLGTTGTTMRDVVRIFFDQILKPTGITFDDFYAALPGPAQVPIDTLQSLPIAPEGIDWAEVADNHVGDALAVALNVAKPFVAAILGLPGAPAYDDLTPHGGVRHLTSYRTNPHVKQFVTRGVGGFGVHLFPPDLQAVAANPELILDVDANVAGPDDSAVPSGSATLLTVTDAFGPHMDLLASLQLEHSEMLYDHLSLLAPVWLEALLSPPTTLHLNGDVTPVSTMERSYVVDPTTSFSFTAPDLTRTVTFPIFGFDPYETSVTVSAVSFEYRVVPAWSGAEPSAWITIAPGQQTTFGELATANGVTEVPFYLEWRSVNGRGGREMVRTARIAVAGPAPQVATVSVLSPNSAEVYRQPTGLQRAAQAVRGTFFDEPGRLDAAGRVLLDQIRTMPEASFVVRDPSNKGLSIALEGRGDVSYAWDGGPPQTRTGVTGWVVPLAGLGEGVHRLRLELSRTTEGVVRRAPPYELLVQVDQTPPLLAFAGSANHPLGRVVGPATPLVFQVQDLGSASGRGTVEVAGNPQWRFDSSRAFSLGRTGLDEQFRAAGISGQTVTLTLTGNDLVQNTATASYDVYFDVQAPEVTLVEAAGTLPGADGRLRAFAPELDLVVDVAESGAGLSGPPRVQVMSAGTERGDFQAPLTLGGVAAHPTRHGGKIRLSPGLNQVVVGAVDLADNRGALALSIELAPPLSDGEPLTLLSPRPITACFDELGDPVYPCVDGTITAAVASEHGEVFLFESAGGRFVAGDSNNKPDIFAVRDGVVTRVSTGPDGTQANGDCTSPAISGNGRYVFFRSTATNLVPGTTSSNLYVKDLATGRLAVISRDAAGQPQNPGNSDSFRHTGVTRSGRYVVYESRANDAVSGITDGNANLDVFLVDLDPDGNGDLFDDNDVTFLLSRGPGNRTANGRSRMPSISLDGRYVAFLTSATDLHPDLADNGTVHDAVLVELTGSDAAGTLDATAPTLVPVSRPSATGGSSVLAAGVLQVRVSPSSDAVLFTTQGNVAGTGDTNSTTLGVDVYLSRRTGAALEPREINWMSRSFQGGNSAGSLNPFLLPSLTLAEHQDTGSLKVAWVSAHDNLVSGDDNGAPDLFVRVEGDVAGARPDLPVINWLSASQPAAAGATFGGVTPDGRHAFWVTRQSYIAPYASNGPDTLYLRRLDPPRETTLTVELDGGGDVLRSADGEQARGAGAFSYDDEARVELVPVAAPGSEFVGWSGVEEVQDGAAVVRMHASRTVRASFVAVPGPRSASAHLTTREGARSPGVRPTVDGPVGQVFTVSIDSPPAHGTAAAEGGFLYYTPADGFTGTDSFTFQVQNQFGTALATPAIATVEVLPRNAPPRAASIEIATSPDTPSAPVLPTVDDDTPGETFQFSLAEPPVSGELAITAEGFVYTPAPGFLGTDTFTFHAADSVGQTVLGTGNVIVGAIDHSGSGGCGCQKAGGGGAVWWLLLALIPSMRRSCRRLRSPGTEA